jgi:hypothetical protein
VDAFCLGHGCSLKPSVKLVVGEVERHFISKLSYLPVDQLDQIPVSQFVVAVPKLNVTVGAALAEALPSTLAQQPATALLKLMVWFTETLLL